MDVDKVCEYFKDKPKRPQTDNFMNRFFSEDYPDFRIPIGRKRRRASKAQFDNISKRHHQDWDFAEPKHLGVIFEKQNNREGQSGGWVDSVNLMTEVDLQNWTD